MATNDNKNTDDLQQLSHLLDEATEELRKGLNKVIGDKQLPPDVVMLLLARIAAGYTHHYQRSVDDPKMKDSIEESFIENYNLCLYDFDQHDVEEEIRLMRKEEMN